MRLVILLSLTVLACGPSRIERLRSLGVEVHTIGLWTRLTLQDVTVEMPGVPTYYRDVFPMGRHAVEHEHLSAFAEANSRLYELDVFTPEPGVRFSGDEQLAMCLAQLRDRHGVTAEPEEEHAGHSGSWPTVDIIIHSDTGHVAFVRVVMTSYQSICTTVFTPTGSSFNEADQRFVRSLRVRSASEGGSAVQEGDAVILDVRVP